MGRTTPMAAIAGMLLSVVLMASLASCQTVYLNPGGTGGLFPTTWGGACTGCASSSPCLVAASTSVSSNCNVVFTSGSVLSGFNITLASTTSVVFSTADSTVAMGTQNVVLSGGNITLLNFYVTMANTGLLSISSGGTITNNGIISSTFIYTSGPGLFVGTQWGNYWFINSVLQTSSSATGLFPLTNIPAPNFQNCVVDHLYLTTSVGNGYTLVFTQSTNVTNSVITGQWFAVQLTQSSSFTNTSFVGPLPGMSTLYYPASVAASSSTFINSTFTGYWGSFNLASCNIYLPPPTYFATCNVLTFDVSYLVSAASKSGSGASTPINLINGTVGSMVLGYLSSSALVNWNTFTISPTVQYPGVTGTNPEGVLLEYSTFTQPIQFASSSGVSIDVIQSTFTCSSSYCISVIGYPPLGIGLGPFEYTQTWNDFSPPGCRIMLGGNVTIVGNVNTTSICANSALGAMVSGTSAIEITQSIGSGGFMDFSNTGGVILHGGVNVASITNVSFPSNEFTFVVANQTSNIVSNAANFIAKTVNISWPYSYLPQPNVPYALLYDPAGTTSLTSVTSPLFNVSLSSTSDKTHWNVTFNSVACNSQCPSSHLSAPCVTPNVCQCASPWSGFYCNCNPATVPTDWMCDPNIPNLWSFNYSIISNPFTFTGEVVSQSVTVPSGFTFLMPGIPPGGTSSITTSIDAPLTLNHAIISTSANLNINTMLTVNSSLIPTVVGSNCWLASDAVFASFGYGSIYFGFGSSVVLNLDTSKISGACVTPTATTSVYAVFNVSSSMSNFVSTMTINIADSTALHTFASNYTVFIVSTTTTSGFTPGSTPSTLTVNKPSSVCYTLTDTYPYQAWILYLFPCAPAPSAPTTPTATPITPTPTSTPTSSPAPTSTPTSSPPPTSTPTSAPPPPTSPAPLSPPPVPSSAPTSSPPPTVATPNMPPSSPSAPVSTTPTSTPTTSSPPPTPTSDAFRGSISALVMISSTIAVLFSCLL